MPPLQTITDFHKIDPKFESEDPKFESDLNQSSLRKESGNEFHRLVQNGHNHILRDGLQCE